MHETRHIMGMPVTVEVVEIFVTSAHLEQVFAHFQEVDERFSTYKETSEISQINAGRHPEEQWSPEMKLVMDLCAQTKEETNGYFDIHYKGKLDPSGVVKGWAIYNAATLLNRLGFQHYYVDAGGDIQTAGNNAEGQPWRVGIRNPFKLDEIIKVVHASGIGVATSGTYLRGQHIYNPHQEDQHLTEVVSLTVIAPTILEADRFATAAFAMGSRGIDFIASLPGFEGYQIDKNGLATYTPGFTTYAY